MIMGNGGGGQIVKEAQCPWATTPIILPFCRARATPYETRRSAELSSPLEWISGLQLFPCPDGGADTDPEDRENQQVRQSD
jgi:hypothetical protein